MSGVASFSYLISDDDDGSPTVQNLGQLCVSCILQLKNFNIQECNFGQKYYCVSVTENVSSVPEMTNK